MGIHTRMVLAELRAGARWQSKPLEKRMELAWACLLHDIAKPQRTRVEDDGSITSRGHSGAGEVQARAILWKAGAPVPDREAICRVAKWHQVPFFAGSRGDELDIKRLSLSMDLSDLAICSEADARGRRTVPEASWGKTLEAIGMFELFAQDLGVWGKPMACAGFSERGLWISKAGGTDPSFPWGDPAPRAVLVVACGLPGSGKSTIASGLGLPTVGLDWARGKLGVEHGEEEGLARALAMDGLKKLLAVGSSACFDATNLVPDQRMRLESLAFDYQADCLFIHAEADSHAQWLARNKVRGAKSLPMKALEGMLSKWGTPVGAEGSGQAYFQGSKLVPVWGAMGRQEFEAVVKKARSLAIEPRGKPLGPKGSRS